jgi:hypothetical protein
VLDGPLAIHLGSEKALGGVDAGATLRAPTIKLVGPSVAGRRRSRRGF